MADGAFRFQPGAAQNQNQNQSQNQNFFQHFGSRNRNQRSSPPLGLRIPFESSPTRTPASQSPSRQNFSSMFLSGGAPRGYPMGLNNMSKQFPHQSHQNQHHGQHQDPSNSGGHGSNYSHHQHSHSGGLTNGSSHFGTAAHISNGAFNPLSKPPSEHWSLQMQMAQQHREWSASGTAHAYARMAQGTSKDLVTTNASMITDTEKEQRQRPNDDAASKPKNQSWTELDLSGQTLRRISPSIMLYRFLTKLYLNNNKFTHIPREIGQLRTLKVLDLSVNELTELPSQIGMLVNLKELLLFNNKLETLPDEIGNLYQCTMLGLEGNPLSPDLKSLVMQGNSLELIKHLRENAPDPEPPNDRDWIVVDESPIADEDKLLLFDYNTLCHHYCNPALYGYTPSRALSWEHRREVIMDELKNRNPDIMTLQEVEHDAFENFFRPNLAHMDYRGVFWPKGRAKTMGSNEAKAVDGCATFYKNSKYILLDKQVVDLASQAINRPDMKGEADIYNRVMPKDNVAVITFFENRMSGARLIVANAHLHWDQEYKDVKVVQVAVLLEVIAKLSHTYQSWPPLKDKEKQPYRFSNGDNPDGTEDQPQVIQPKPSMSYNDSTSIPLILCGDFNSLPLSGPVELISKGHLAPNHPDLENRKYGKFTRDGMDHPFSLKSAYSTVGELPFTNYVSNFEGVVDYIWYANNTLTLRGLLGQVDPEYIARVPGFPNVHFPSDHLALFAEFGIKPRRTAANDKDKS